MFLPFRFGLLMLTCTLMLGACAPGAALRPLTAEAAQDARAGKRAVVMFQLEAVIDGKPASASAAADSNRSFRVYVARMDKGETPARVQLAAWSEDAGASGWRHLLLEPGTYYVLVLPPGVEQNPPAVAYHAASGKFGRLTRYRFEPGRGGFWAPELMAFVLPNEAPDDFRELSGFWLEVPAGRPLLYAGSLRVACTDGRGLGGLIDSCSDFDLRRNAGEARDMAGSMPSLGPPHEAPLVAYGTARRSGPAADLSGARIVMTPWSSLDAAYAGAQLAPYGVLHGVQRPILVYNLLAILAHEIQQAVATKDAERLSGAAAACMQRLSSDLAKIDGEQAFRMALARAHAKAVRSPVADGALLQVRPTLIRLRESPLADRVALELGLHIRLQAGTASPALYEGRLVFAEPFPRENPFERSTRLYERRTAQSPAAYPISRWCGPDGAALLEEEITRAFAAIATRFVRDLE